MLARYEVRKQVAPLVLADGDVLHLWSDYALLRVVHLRDATPSLRAQWFAPKVEAKLCELAIGEPLAPVARRRPGQFLRVSALGDPRSTQCAQAAADVDLDLRIGVRARSIVDVDRRVLFGAEGSRGVRLDDFPHGDSQVGARALDVDLARVGQGFHRGIVDVRGGGYEFGIGVHGAPLALCRGSEDESFNASLRRHYPHQVRRVCSHPAGEKRVQPGPLRCSGKLTPSRLPWQAVSRRDARRT